MTTEQTLDQYSRVLGIRLESMLLNTDHHERLIAESTYKTQRWQLMHRLERLTGTSKTPEPVCVLWKDGAAVVLPPEPEKRS